MAKRASTKKVEKTDLSEWITRFVDEFINVRDIDRIDEFFALDHSDDAAASAGIDFLRSSLDAWWRAFPDLTLQIEQTISNEGEASFRGVLAGTHQDTYKGIPATGRRIAVSDFWFVTVTDGKVSKMWRQIDVMSLFQQIGTISIAVSNSNQS